MHDIKDGFDYIPNVHGRPIQRFDNDAIFFEQICYKTRHFLNCNVALQTRVVAHCVDGIHRMTALECGLNGFSGQMDDKQSITTYHNTLPHSKMMINSMVILLTESHVKNGESFIAAIKNLSSVTQNNCGCLQKLGKKVFFRRMIQLLDTFCEENYYIMDQLLINDNNLDDIMDTIMDQIMTTLCNKEAKKFYALVPRMMLDGINESNAEDWKSVFKSRGGRYDQCFLCNKRTVTAVHIIHKWSFLYHENRYGHATINAELFELLLILIWSRLSKDTYIKLDEFFGYDSTMPQISTANDQLVNEWLTSMIINVFSLVYYSSLDIWKNMTEEERKNKIKIAGGKKTDVYIKQLMRAIITCTDNFAQLGPNPVLPSWFENVQKQIVAEQYVLKQYQNLVTEAGFSESIESVARRKDSIAYLIRTGSWRNYLNFYSFVTVAYSHYLSHHPPQKQSVSLEMYLESQIEQDIKGDECLTSITNTFLKYHVPRKEAAILHNMPHTIPNKPVYALIEEVVTNFKSRGVRDGLKGKMKTAATHLEKFQIERLLTLIESVDVQLFNDVYVSEMNRSREKKS